MTDVSMGAVFGNQFISPLHDYVMVVPLGHESESGLVLPEGQTSLPCRGRVVGVGPGRAPDALVMTVKTGDVVLYGPSPKVQFRNGSEGFILMREQEIYAIVSDVSAGGDPQSN